MTVTQKEHKLSNHKVQFESRVMMSVTVKLICNHVKQMKVVMIRTVERFGCHMASLLLHGWMYIVFPHLNTTTLLLSARFKGVVFIWGACSRAAFIAFSI